MAPNKPQYSVMGRRVKDGGPFIPRRIGLSADDWAELYATAESNYMDMPDLLRRRLRLGREVEKSGRIVEIRAERAALDAELAALEQNLKTQQDDAQEQAAAGDPHVQGRPAAS